MMHPRPLQCVFMLVGALLVMPARADLDLERDGWYRWEVPAGPNGIEACCYEVRGGSVERVACRLGDGMLEFSPGVDCVIRSDSMQIFVEVRDERAVEIQALSSACPVRSGAEIRTLEGVSAQQSIAWLKRQVELNPGVSEDAIMTLSFHAHEQGLQALFDILEDTGQRRSAREEALFWLIHSGSDEAFAYLERLLD